MPRPSRLGAVSSAPLPAHALILHLLAPVPHESLVFCLRSSSEWNVPSVSTHAVKGPTPCVRIALAQEVLPLKGREHLSDYQLSAIKQSSTVFLFYILSELNRCIKICIILVNSMKYFDTSTWFSL